MPPSPPAEKPRLPPERQRRLRAELVELEPDLVRRARVLCGRLREPRPEPLELCNEVAARLLATYADDEVDSVRKIAFRVLANLAADAARRYRFEVGPTDEVPEVGAGMAPTLRAIWPRLAERERCVLIRINLEHLPVKAAFGECGWDTPSAHYRYALLLDQVRSMIVELPR